MDNNSQEPGNVQTQVTAPMPSQPAAPEIVPPPLNVDSGSTTPPAMKQSRKLSLIVLGALIMVLAGSAFVSFQVFQAGPKKDSAIVPAQTQRLGMSEKKEKIIFGTDATYPPMESIDAKTGGLVGFDIDLGNKIAEEMGDAAEFSNIPWDDVFIALEQGKIDAIVSSVTITDERKQKYLFSNPYINAGQVIVVSRTSTNAATLVPEQLAGKKVGVQADTTSEVAAKKYIQASMITSYKDYLQAANDLSTGKIDAMFIDLTAAKGLIDKLPNLRIASDPFTKEEYGFVLKKDNVVLQQRINTVIESLRERGILDNLKQKWFQ
jgi:polar amino acid transport system substrate-binding protein